MESQKIIKKCIWRRGLVASYQNLRRDEEINGFQRQKSMRASFLPPIPITSTGAEQESSDDEARRRKGGLRRGQRRRLRKLRSLPGSNESGEGKGSALNGGRHQNGRGKVSGKRWRPKETRKRQHVIFIAQGPRINWPGPNISYLNLLRVIKKEHSRRENQFSPAWIKRKDAWVFKYIQILNSMRGFHLWVIKILNMFNTTI